MCTIEVANATGRTVKPAKPRRFAIVRQAFSKRHAALSSRYKGGVHAVFRSWSRTVAWLLALAACHASPRPEPETRTARALKALDAARIEKDTRYLASDALEGRAPGTPGGGRPSSTLPIATASSVSRRAAMPGRTSSRYRYARRHRPPLWLSRPHHTASSRSIRPATCSCVATLRTAHVAVDAPLVFVGYGLERADLGYDDLAGVDLHGAIAVIFSGVRRTLGGKPVDPALHAALAEVSPRTRVFRDHGAVGFITIWDPARARVQPWSGIFEKAPRVGLPGSTAARPPPIRCSRRSPST